MTLILREPFATLAAWTNLGGASLVAGRNGTGIQVTGTSSSADFRFPASAESEYVTVGFALKPNQLSYNWMFSLASDAGATQHLHVLTTLNGGFEARLGPNGVTLGVTVGGLYTTTTWAYVEVQARLHDTAGSVIIRINGVERLNLTGLDTRNGGTKTVFDTVHLGWLQFAGHVYDDMYVATGADETFRGDMAITTEAWTARESARVAFSEPKVDWYRETSISSRVGFSEPPPKDWYRQSRESVRVAFRGADTAARLGGFEARVLSRGSGGRARVGGFETRVLFVPGADNAVALVGGFVTRVLRSFAPPDIRFWDSSAYIAGPARTWNGTNFAPALAVRTWNGSTWVDQP